MGKRAHLLRATFDYRHLFTFLFPPQNQQFRGYHQQRQGEYEIVYHRHYIAPDFQQQVQRWHGADAGDDSDGSEEP